MTRLFRVTYVLAVLAAWAPGRTGQAMAQPPATLLVFAAASTKEAVDDALKSFAKNHSHVSVKVSYGSSAALAHQLQLGAEADLFLSANQRWVDALEEKGLIARRHDLLGNGLAVIVPADSKLELTGPEDLLNDRVQRIAIGQPDSVPAGIYARQALTGLGLWKRIKSKAVGGADVRQALAYVETGAAEAGIVYSTDAAISKRVKVAFALDEKLSGPIVYPWALMKQARDKPAAAALYESFQTQAAAEIFRRYGFSAPAATADRKP